MNNVLKDILKKIESMGEAAYIVGGYVRDYLLGINSLDIDICTSASVSSLLKILPGTKTLYDKVHLNIDNFNIDITTFRDAEVNKNGKPIFYNKGSLDTDLLRRDFTINTICMDKEGNIIDLLGGVKDLENKIIRMVGDPYKKIIEDPSRILRAIRFKATLDFEIDESLEKVIKEKRSVLKNLSYFVIKKEVTKILSNKKGFDLLKEYDLLKYLGITANNIVYTSDIIGVWAQLGVLDVWPFTRLEKVRIKKIKEILDLKIITPVIIYKYGLKDVMVSSEILGISKEEIKEMNEIVIKVTNNLDISDEEIAKTLNIKNVKNIKDKIIESILSDVIINKKESIIDYLNKGKWF